MIGYEYGNARLRARWSRRLEPSDLSTLLTAPDLDHFVGVLAAGDYAPDVEASLPRFGGLRRVDEIVRRHLTRQFLDVRSFYAGEAPAVHPLFDRWDVRNLITIVRGQVARMAAPLVTGLLLPVGRIGASVLAELAAQPGLRAMVDLMVAWSVPSRRAARSLAVRLGPFDESGDAALLESALHETDAVGGAPEVTATLRSEIDATNLVTALRVRQARLDGEPYPTGPWLPGGTIRAERFDGLVFADDAASTAAAAADLTPDDWSTALRRWEAGGDLGLLEHALTAARLRRDMTEFHAGDPLGAAVPVGFVAAKLAEAHDLRLLARAIVHGLPTEALQERLIL